VSSVLWNKFVKIMQAEETVTNFHKSYVWHHITNIPAA